MPRPLHFVFKYGLDFEGCDHPSDHSFDDPVGSSATPEEQAAKRRRVEIIANKYLRYGTVPIIQSASLKGPFDKGWKNPWTKDTATPEKERPRRGASKVRNHTGKQGAQQASSKVSKPSKPPKPSRDSSAVASPETARAAEPAPTFEHEGDTIDLVVGLGGNYPDRSSATEFFSARTDDLGQSNSNSKSDTNWLRRPQFKPTKSSVYANSREEASPTRIQQGFRPTDSRGELQLAPPRIMLPKSPNNGIAQASLESGAPYSSASMVITSPLRSTGRSSSTAVDRPIYGTNETLETMQYAQEREFYNSVIQDSNIQQDTNTLELAVSHSLPVSQTNNAAPSTSREEISIPSSSNGKLPVLLFKDADTTIKQGYLGAKALAHLAVSTASRPSTSLAMAGTSPAREQVHMAALRCARTPQSSTKKTTRQRASRSATKSGLWGQSQPHDQAGPPLSAPDSFAYQKVGPARSKAKNAKSRPRPVTFSSSPVAERKEAKRAKNIYDIPSEDVEPHDDTVQGAPIDEEWAEQTMGGANALDQMTEGVEQNEGEELDGSRNSYYSTQTAMRQAQLEFQQGTFTSEVPDSNLALAHMEEEISRADDDAYDYEPASPAYTPFRKFNAEFDKKHPPDADAADNALEAPMSTQELLNAASPLAFSTLKKKVPRPQGGSSLKFAVLSHEEPSEFVVVGTEAKSPTPSNEGVGLKIRNGLPFRSTASEKGSQETMALAASGAAAVREVDEESGRQVEEPTSFHDLEIAEGRVASPFARNLAGLG
ncbi:hypothetical protein BS50DRAFT_174700 [Corynespora cassiicola Philippines]|uniref:Protamine P1 n=1 Tax=Corynespora cassiicola Philippines TaxID=1448308 RepID=A0A2T2P5L0_CORCC|nr:hypothetical protein BS50DRAFT_174700 [Corynespora cassiicola Philippines]